MWLIMIWSNGPFGSRPALIRVFFESPSIGVAAMQAIRKQAAFVKQHKLFRAASASHVISILYQLLLRDKIDERVSETIYQLLPKVSKTDVFISHSWSCPAWKKILAICHYLNLHLAILASLIAAALAVAILVHASGSFSAVAKQSSSLLYGVLMCWPMAVLLVGCWMVNQP